MSRTVRRAVGTVVCMVGVVIAGGGPSSGQTTTTSTSTTMPTTTTSTSTTATTSTSTTVPRLSDPVVPAATLSGSAGQVTGDLGSFTWPTAEGVSVSRIVDYTEDGPNPPQTLTARQGETLTLRFGTTLPVSAISGGVFPDGVPGRPTLAIRAANPAQFVVTLAPGTHVISVTATFQAPTPARASYNFRLRVVGRSLSLTG